MGEVISQSVETRRLVLVLLSAFAALALDPLTFASVPVLIGIVGIVAGVLPD